MRLRYKDRRSKGIARVRPSHIYYGYEIGSLYVRKKNNGGGTRIMRRILSDADRENEILYLVVVPSGPMDKKQLHDWYQRLGFEDFGSMWMRRVPRHAHCRANNRSVRYRKGR